MRTSAPRFSKSRLEKAGFGVFLAVAVLPIAASLVYALLYTVGWAGLLAQGFTGAVWLRVLKSGELWSAWGLSLAVAAAVALLSTALGLALALTCGEPLRRGPLAYAIYLPLALPGTVAAFLAFQLFTASGLLSRLAFRLGLSAGIADFPALVNDRWALGIIATHTALATPFLALLFVQLAESERVAEYAALARSLGATRRQALGKVVVPILLSAAATNVLLLFVVVLGSYEIPLLLGRQSPQMLAVLTLRKFQRYDLAQKPEAFVHSLLYTAVATALLAFALSPRRRRAPRALETEE